MRPDSPLLGIYVRLDTAYGRLREAAYELDQLDGEQAAPGAAYEARALADAVTVLQRGIDDADAGGPAADDGTRDRGWRIDPADGSLVIRTLEGDMHANPGDWIIRGVAGELYPYRQDIFEQTYEPARCTPEPDSDLKEES